MIMVIQVNLSAIFSIVKSNNLIHFTADVPGFIPGKCDTMEHKLGSKIDVC